MGGNSNRGAGGRHGVATGPARKRSSPRLFSYQLTAPPPYRAFMLARVRSAAVLGIDAYLVDVEADIANGLPSFAPVGLPHGAVKEGRERVGAAIANAGFEFPLKRITVNLAPADIRKDGSAFDLPIALGVLAATGQLGGTTEGRYGGGQRGDRAADVPPYRPTAVPSLADYVIVG